MTEQTWKVIAIISLVLILGLGCYIVMKSNAEANEKELDLLNYQKEIVKDLENEEECIWKICTEKFHTHYHYDQIKNICYCYNHTNDLVKETSMEKIWKIK